MVDDWRIEGAIELESCDLKISPPQASTPRLQVIHTNVNDFAKVEMLSPRDNPTTMRRKVGYCDIGLERKLGKHLPRHEYQIASFASKTMLLLHCMSAFPVRAIWVLPDCQFAGLLDLNICDTVSNVDEI
ncbi:MAG: hypothetical protein KGZ65_00275 [Sphingomonadales bacterium]|nr:hypothetical protein [Sphingomonadaceae bacterium]MBS3929641.1 hypothetical protein [Sphingomonadales bacterium]